MNPDSTYVFGVLRGRRADRASARSTKMKENWSKILNLGKHLIKRVLGEQNYYFARAYYHFLLSNLQGKKAVSGLPRTHRYSKHYYWLDQSQIKDDLDITELVSPLRYDIVIRKDFISLYLSNQDLYHSDFDSFLELAIQHPYYVCFQKMKPQLLGAETVLRRKFADRIRSFIGLYSTMVEFGFDKTMPIVPKTGLRILPTKEGKKISGKFFMGDGCHRLACLMALGYDTLPIDYIRVQCFQTLTPRDGTVELVHSVPIDPKKYFAFLASRYSAPYCFERGEEFVEYIKREKPNLLDEVLSAIRGDRMMALHNILNHAKISTFEARRA